GPASVALLQRQSAVGGDRVRVGVRQPAVGGRQGGRSVRTQVGADRWVGRVLRRVGGRWAGPVIRGARACEGDAGGVRRAARPVGAVAVDGHLRGDRGLVAGV